MSVDTKALRETATSWLRRGDGSLATRDNAISEESMALDLLEAVDEIEDLRERHLHCGAADCAQCNAPDSSVRASIKCEAPMCTHWSPCEPCERVLPGDDEIDSVMSLLNWTREKHDADSTARLWLERVVAASLRKAGVK